MSIRTIAVTDETSAKTENDSVVERLVIWMELDDSVLIIVETGTCIHRDSLYSLHVRRCFIDAV